MTFNPIKFIAFNAQNGHLDTQSNDSQSGGIKSNNIQHDDHNGDTQHEQHCV